LEGTSGPLADGASGLAYVGRGRAKDLAVNVVLPFMHACDQWQALQKMSLNHRPNQLPKNRALRKNSTGILICGLQTR
jgi:hypothetical protein